mgnify:CR=1 FL=1
MAKPKDKFKEWKAKKEENLILLQGWIRDGLTDEQIARNMRISRSTLNEWKKKDSDISDTLKKGKEIVDYQVENSLLKEALKGNVTACIYWLKNRRPDKWREQPKETPAEADIPKFLDDIK